MSEEITMKEVGEMLTHVVQHMATKEDVEELVRRQDDFATKQDELARRQEAFASELSIVRHDVEEIKETVESHNGFAKEIDHTMDRVTGIEKHLGIATV